MALIEFLILGSVILYSIYKWITIRYDFFDKKNIPYEKPFFIFGNMKGIFLRTESMYHSLIRLHKKFNKEQVYGVFESRNPLIVINDFDLIKQVTVKDFDYFMNHRSLIEEQDDPLFGCALFSLKDQKWKDMRSTLSPAFTGSKMRLIFQLIKDCTDSATKFLKDESTKNKDGIDLDLKDFFTRYTNDVIATAAFGIKVDSYVDRENQFYLMGKKATNFTGWVMLKFFLFASFRNIMRFFRMRIFDKTFEKYFISLVMDAMQYRKKHNIIRPDMINMLMEARESTEKNHTREWSDIEIVAQCFIFFLAGFETTSQLMCFSCYELMENPETQQKLVEEIQEVKKQLNGEPLNYEKLHGMKYLDMIVSETLRKWPGALATDRVCTKPYQLKTDTKVIDLEVGDAIWLNITGMHHDPNNFPNPSKFDPERFNDENKNSFDPYSYIPFGLGPRNCIGNRFALMEVKAILYYLISEFEIKRSEKARVPFELEAVGFALKPKGGFWLKFIPRK